MSIWRQLKSSWQVAPFLLIQIFLVVFPLSMLILVSLTPKLGAWGDWTLANYRQLFDPAIGKAAANSLIASLGGTLLAVVIGSWLGWLAARTDMPHKKVIEAAAIVPLFTSPLVAALAWSAIGSPRSGLANVVLRELGLPWVINVHSLGGLVFVFGLYYAPYVYLLVSRALLLMDSSLEEAAHVHGATTFTTLRKITLPLVRPAMLGATLLVFVMTIDNFSVAAVLGEPAGLTLVAPYIWKLLNWTPPKTAMGATVGLALVAFTAILVALQRKVLGQKSYTTVTGKGIRPNLTAIGRWKWFGLATAVAYIGLSVVLPYLVLIQIAFRNYFAVYSVSDLFDVSAFTLGNFAILFSVGGFRPILNSLYIGTTVAVVGGFLSFALGYVVYRTRLPGRNLIQYLAMLPVAVPGIIMGLAYALAFLSIPTGLYGTVFIIALAYVSRFMPQGFTSASSTMAQVHVELEESSRVSGASLWQTIWYVTFPLVRQGVFSSMVLLFILGVRELNIAMFLYTAKTVPLPVAIFDLWESGMWPATAMLSLLQGIFLFVTVGLARWLFRLNLQVG